MAGFGAIRNHTHDGVIGRIPEARDQEHQAGRNGTDAKNIRVKKHQELGQGRIVKTRCGVP